MKKKILSLVFFALAFVLFLCFVHFHNEEAGVPEPQAGALMTVDINGVKVNFRWAPAGTFVMGSQKGGLFNLWRQHRVKLSQGFWVAETETTQELWKSVMGDTPSHFKGSMQLPVEQVSWYDSQRFVHRLNGVDVTINGVPNDYKFSLPTEAQWEYACRAGTSTPYNFGFQLSVYHANCRKPFSYDRSFEKTTPVKSYAPNALGLYDMHGNVEEWTFDRFDSGYYKVSSSRLDPTGPVSDDSHVDNLRVARGGSWFSLPSGCRSEVRHYASPSIRDSSCGFRLVLVESSQPQVVLSEVAIAEPEYPNGDAPEASREAGALKTLDVNGVQVNFHWAPAGTFQMGSYEPCEYNHHRGSSGHTVELTHGFWVAETETTQELWQSVMSNNPSYFKDSDQLPVENVSWHDCHDFLDKLNSSYTNSLPSGYKYAMPTEAQWEYACRAGTTTYFNFGDVLNGNKANCNGGVPYGTHSQGSYLERTAFVKRDRPNAWGLYDMHGNVEEWTTDWDAPDNTRVSFMTDPVGPISASWRNSRVTRGGNWNCAARFCQSVSRGCATPATRVNTLGFRLVLVPESQQQYAQRADATSDHELPKTPREYRSGDEP